MEKYNGLIGGRILNNKHNYYLKLGVYEKLYKTYGKIFKKQVKIPINIYQYIAHSFKINMEQKK